MQFTRLAAVFSFFVAACHAAALTRSSARCSGARAVSTEMIGAVNFTTFACPEAPPVDLKAAAASISKRDTSPVPGTSIANVPRQFQNCAGGASDPECECAVLCGSLSFCTGSEAVAPAQSDCQTIDNELSTVAGSFFVEANMGVSFTFQSCEAVWINEAGRELEYCFENFGQLTSVSYTNCVIVDGGGQGGCIADDFNWFFEFLIPGNTIIVP
ncbi:hypothetical protein A0H81_05089 [Grifola frondosa]|uniref:Uncharacterized protein n=1 Tax=Grifola frondosa TaxID=5627 RepID=A0A1C7MDF0_GRIFR|nr:hypothetical protein A0H81_05089 [Grifola frondosa]